MSSGLFTALGALFSLEFGFVPTGLVSVAIGLLSYRYATQSLVLYPSKIVKKSVLSTETIPVSEVAEIEGVSGKKRLFSDKLSRLYSIRLRLKNGQRRKFGTSHLSVSNTFRFVEVLNQLLASGK